MYATDRGAFFVLIRQFEPDLTDAELKNKLLAISHGGKASHDRPPIGILAEYERQIHTAALELKTKPHYADMYAKCVEKGEENALGSFISCAWQEVERKVLMQLLDYFQKIAKVNVGALSFDGLMVEKHQPDLPAAEQYVLEKTGYVVDLFEKSLVPTKED